MSNNSKRASETELSQQELSAVQGGTVIGPGFLNPFYRWRKLIQQAAEAVRPVAMY